MHRSHSFRPAAFSARVTRAGLLEALRRPPMASQFSAPAMTLVLSIRLMASCVKERRDPLADLACRLESIAAAKAVLDFAQGCARAWPETAAVNRPCCHALTPDEAVFAQMAEAAAAADRAAFAAVLDGFVRRERHERLYLLSQEAVAAFSAAP